MGHSLPTPAVDFIIIIVKGIYSESTEKSKTTCTFEIIDTLGVTDNYSKDTMPMKQNHKPQLYGHLPACKITHIKNV